jgi:hypothetical protein
MSEASGHGARQADGGHHGFRAGIAKGGAIHSAEFTDIPRDLSGCRRLRADLDPVPQLLLQGVHQPVRRVTEKVRPKAHGDVHVRVAVHIPDGRAFRARRDNRVNHLLPERLKS